jgi:L-amino acid N-acyltransferase YncA
MLQEIPESITLISIHVRKITEENNHRFQLEDYLKRIGGTMVIADRSSASDISQFNPDDVQKEAKLLQIKAEEMGYDIYLVENGKYSEVKEINYPRYVKMLERIWNDMPRDDATWEDEVLTEEHHQVWYRECEILGKTAWTFVAVDRESRLPIALTESWLEEDVPELSWQDDTGVLAEHRGRNLGLTLKYQMLARLLTHEKSQSVKYWTTGNANSNSHMLRINDILGYKEVAIYHMYEFDRKEFEEYFAL